jgi:hypothetical protein
LAELAGGDDEQSEIGGGICPQFTGESIGAGKRTCARRGPIRQRVCSL